MTKLGIEPSKSINHDLRDKWVSLYGDHYSIREYLESDSTSYTHLELKRLIANDISTFLTQNGIEPSSVNIEAFIDLLEPAIDERDYLEELGEEDIDTEDYLGC